jgi:hypothetical protein
VYPDPENHVNDKDRFVFDSDQLYFKSPEEMIGYFGDYSGAIENTVAIADRCHIEFDFKTYHFPQFDADSGKTADELFDEQVREGYERRMAVMRKKQSGLDEAAYKERLEYELKTIIEMGFPGYFLIVADFIRYAKENGIPVGPGRGSAAGSLVSFALFITDLDPIEHGLIFERFLNPSRISMPDIDVDFCIHGREKVYNYVVERYGGGDYVAQIITFGKMKAKLVIRDVGRALGLPLAEVDTIAKLIPDSLKMTIDKALKEEPKLKEDGGSGPAYRRTDRYQSGPGRAFPPCLHPCGRCCDRRQTPGRIPAPVQGEKRGGCHPVRHEEGGGYRSGEIRFSGLAQPDRDRPRVEEHRPPGKNVPDWITCPLTMRRRFPAPIRRHHRRVPAGIQRHEKPAGPLASGIL